MVMAGDSAAFYESVGKKSAPAGVSDMDEVGVTVRIQGQTVKGARFCVRKRQDPGDVVNVE